MCSGGGGGKGEFVVSGVFGVGVRDKFEIYCI